MKQTADIAGYQYDGSQLNHSHRYLLPVVTQEVTRQVARNSRDRRLFDLGCGNGSVAAHFAELGLDVTGVDVSSEGIAEANAAYPNLRLENGSAYDDLFTRYGSFPIVISLEVVEHVYAPRDYAATLFSLVAPGGIAIVSTPYHGYWKNPAMAASGTLDKHFTALWDHGHIKFWSMKTLRALLQEAGFESIRYRRVGRIPALARSMVAVASRR